MNKQTKIWLVISSLSIILMITTMFIREMSDKFPKLFLVTIVLISASVVITFYYTRKSINNDETIRERLWEKKNE